LHDMDITTTLVELLKYTVPALVVLGASVLIVNRFVIGETERKQLALFHDAQDVTLKLRLQAYERLTIFIERISARNLLMRIYDPTLTVMEYREVLVTSISSEFEHNLSQQIYVSPNVWQTIKGVKEQEINMINQITKTLDAEAPAKELRTRILEMLAQVEEETPTDVALHIINKEAKMMMFNQQ